MSGFKGKPGPWHWEDKVLCNDEHIVGGDGWTFNDADKRLIAAAPDLLKELEETHAALCFTSDYIGSERYKRNMAAIAKALGNN